MTTTVSNKSEIVALMAETAGISKAAASTALDSLVEGITSTLKAGESVSIPNLGTFVSKPRAERKGRNPRTGEEITIAAANIPSFKAGKALKDAVNSGSVVSETTTA